MMLYPKAGFILIEALVSLVIITICIVSFMRCHVQGLTLQAYALKIMYCIDCIEENLDNASGLANKIVSICNNSAKVIVHAITKPVIYAAPDRLVLNDASHMKAVAISVSCNKDGHNETYCMATITTGKCCE